MKNSSKKLIRIVAIILALAGIGVKYQMDKQAQLKQRMIEIVKSEEVRQVIENRLTNLDSKALSENGIIKKI